MSLNRDGIRRKVLEWTNNGNGKQWNEEQKQIASRVSQKPLLSAMLLNKLINDLKNG